MFTHQELQMLVSGSVGRYKLPYIWVHRVFYQALTMEIHWTDGHIANSAAHFWIQSVQNLLDYTFKERHDFFGNFVVNACCKPVLPYEFLKQYNYYLCGLPDHPFLDLQMSLGTINRAMIMKEEWNDWSALCETDEKFISVYWQTTD